MLPEMSRSVTTLTVLCLLLASLSGCHLISGGERTWDVNPEVRNATAIEDGYVMEMGFQFGGRADAPVNMEGVKLVFISPNETNLNETVLGSMRFYFREYESFNVTLPRRPEYIQLKYTSLNHSGDATGAVEGLQYQDGNPSYYTTYDDYDAKYKSTDS